MHANECQDFDTSLIWMESRRSVFDSFEVNHWLCIVRSGHNHTVFEGITQLCFISHHTGSIGTKIYIHTHVCASVWMQSYRWRLSGKCVKGIIHPKMSTAFHFLRLLKCMLLLQKPKLWTNEKYSGYNNIKKVSVIMYMEIMKL